MGPAHLDFPNSKVAHIPVRMCPYCHRPLMKIDHYGEVLIGCVHCNYWGRPGDKRPIMEMLEDDLEALRASVRRKRH